MSKDIFGCNGNKGLRRGCRSLFRPPGCCGYYYQNMFLHLHIMAGLLVSVYLKNFIFGGRINVLLGITVYIKDFQLVSRRRPI